ncbi:MAG: hypothetical protein ACK55Z_25860, partial [bacterium]
MHVLLCLSGRLIVTRFHRVGKGGKQEESRVQLQDLLLHHRPVSLQVGVWLHGLLVHLGKAGLDAAHGRDARQQLLHYRDLGGFVDLGCALPPLLVPLFQDDKERFDLLR